MTVGAVGTKQRGILSPKRSSQKGLLNLNYMIKISKKIKKEIKDIIFRFLDPKK